MKEQNMIKIIILPDGKMISPEEAEELYQDLARQLGKVPIDTFKPPEKVNFGKHQTFSIPCIRDSMTEDDRGKAMLLYCPCPRCSPITL